MAYTLSNKCAKNICKLQFYFNLSSKTWSHVFLEHSVDLRQCMHIHDVSSFHASAV